MLEVGDLVCEKRDLNRIGRLIEINRQLAVVDWNDSGPTTVVFRNLQPAPDRKPSVLELLSKLCFGKKKDLRLAVVQQRLSGFLEDMIYSLNFTNTTFYPYQFKPLLTFLRSRTNSLLIADEVGLGKTIEAGLIWTELQMRIKAKRLLVVCPAVLCTKWKAELQDKFKVNSRIVNSSELIECLREIDNSPTDPCVLITSIQGCRPPKDWENEKNKRGSAQLARYLEAQDTAKNYFDLLILDEAHLIRNPETKSFAFIENIRPFCEAVLMLSATPIQTSTDNLFSLLNTLDSNYFPTKESLIESIKDNEPLVKLCDVLASKKISKSEFVAALEDICIQTKEGIKRQELEKWKREVQSKNDELTEKDRSFYINELTKLNPLSQLMTRALKRHVQERRVVREPRMIGVPLNPYERALYDTVTETVRQACAQERKPVGFIDVMPQRLLASSPQAALKYWLDDSFLAQNSGSGDKEKRDFETDAQYQESEDDDQEEIPRIRLAIRRAVQDFPYQQNVLAQDGKYKKLYETLIRYWKENPQKKVLLFSFFKKTLASLHDQLKQDGIDSIVFDGSVPKEERGALIERFKNGKTRIILCSEVAAEGIDLQFMDCLINYDIPWNPAKIEQRIGRIDRIGQKSDKILIFNFVHEDTIDFRMYTLLLERLKIFEQALGVGEEILGEKIRELTGRLFSTKLTPEQEARVIEQSELALENLRQQGEEAEGNSVVFDAFSKQIQKAKELERYITSDDLRAYIEEYCALERNGSRLRPVDLSQDLFELEVSSRTQAQYEEFVETERIQSSAGILSSDLNVKVRIRNKQEEGKDPFERITQTHSFIRYITNWLKKEKKQPSETASVKLLRRDLKTAGTKEISSGTYFYMVNVWGSRDSQTSKYTLSYSAVSIDTGEYLDDEQSELLINCAGTNGEDWPTNSVKSEITGEQATELYSGLFLRDDENFSLFKERQTVSHQADIEFQINQYQKEIEKAKEKYRRQIENDPGKDVGYKGRLKKYANSLTRTENQYNKKIEGAKLRGIHFSVSNTPVSTGLIKLI